jgi:hypothetical protein
VRCRDAPKLYGRAAQLNLHEARVRRNYGRLPPNGFIESAPEHRARAHFFPESAPPIKR